MEELLEIDEGSSDEERDEEEQEDSDDEDARTRTSRARRARARAGARGFLFTSSSVCVVHKSNQSRSSFHLFCFSAQLARRLQQQEEQEETSLVASPARCLPPEDKEVSSKES